MAHLKVIWLPHSSHFGLHSNCEELTGFVWCHNWRYQLSFENLILNKWANSNHLDQHYFNHLVILRLIGPYWNCTTNLESVYSTHSFLFVMPASPSSCTDKVDLLPESFQNAWFNHLQIIRDLLPRFIISQVQLHRLVLLFACSPFIKFKYYNF